MALPGSGVSVFKILGIFGILLMFIIWLGPTMIGVGKAVKTGEWSGVLKETGGRVFAIDAILKQETDYLLNNDDQVYTQIFHLAHALTLLFLLFLVGFYIFRLGSWLLGIKALSPSSDVFLIIGIILLFLSIEFFYAWKVLGVVIVPLKDGVIYFLRKLPSILNNMIS